MAEDRVDDGQDLEVLAVQALERAAGARVGRRRDEVAARACRRRRTGGACGSRQSRTASCQLKAPVLPKIRLFPASWRSCSKRKLTTPTPALPVVLESGERPGVLADVALGVAAAGTEREELHQLAPVVLVRRPLRVLRAREPEEHRRVPRDLLQHLVERAERRAVAGACSGPASASASRRRRVRSRTSRARRASSARRAGGEVRTIRSSHQRWSWPHASAGASARPLSSRGAGPTNFSPRGCVSERTAPSKPSFASAAASPLRGPKPARQSRRSACSCPKGPL